MIADGLNDKLAMCMGDVNQVQDGLLVWIEADVQIAVNGFMHQNDPPFDSRTWLNDLQPLRFVHMFPKIGIAL